MRGAADQPDLDGWRLVMHVERDGSFRVLADVKVSEERPLGLTDEQALSAIAAYMDEQRERQ